MQRSIRPRGSGPQEIQPAPWRCLKCFALVHVTPDLHSFLCLLYQQMTASQRESLCKRD